MNKLKCISALTFLFTVIFISCTTEPYGGTELVTTAPTSTTTPPPVVTPVPVTSVVGNYRLTAHNTSTPTDLNGNGTASVNQMLETACFNNSSLTINANGTFSVLDNYADINNIGGVDTVICATNTDTGTWTFAGNVLTLTTTVGSITQVQTGVFANNVLTVNVQDTEFINIVNGLPDFVDGNVQLVFTKQ
jgi:Lipocalin-like domain